MKKQLIVLGVSALLLASCGGNSSQATSSSSASSSASSSSSQVSSEPQATSLTSIEEISSPEDTFTQMTLLDSSDEPIEVTSDENSKSDDSKGSNSKSDEPPVEESSEALTEEESSEAITEEGSREQSEAKSADNTLAPISEESSEALSEDLSSEEEATSEASEESSAQHQNVQVDFTAFVPTFMDKTRDVMEITTHYDSSYLEEDNMVQNNALSLFALSMAYATNGEERATAVFSNAGFDEHLDVSTLIPSPTPHSVGYAIGSRKVNGVDQIVVSLRGQDYTQEWVNNVTLLPDGEPDDYNGDHYGFHISALKVIEGIKAFVEEHHITRAKYLFTGYSRGAAVSGLAAAMMVDDPIACTEEDIYAYTFASPAGLAADHASEAYNCIFNYLNENDLVTMFAPRSYGFVRPGVDVICSEGIVDYSNIIEAAGLAPVSIDESNDFSSLGIVDASGNPDNSGKAGFSFLVNMLTRELSRNDIAHGVVSFHTAEEYRENLQRHIQVVMGLLFSLPIKFELDAILSAIPELLSLLTGLSADDGFDEEGDTPTPYDPTSLYGFFRTFLAGQGIYPEGEIPEAEGSEPVEVIATYDAEIIQPAVNGVQAAIRNLQLGFTEYFVNVLCYDVSTARMMLMLFLANLLVNGSLMNRHSYDIGYAVFLNYCTPKE